MLIVSRLHVVSILVARGYLTAVKHHPILHEKPPKLIIYCFKLYLTNDRNNILFLTICSKEEHYQSTTQDLHLFFKDFLEPFSSKVIAFIDIQHQ